MNRPPLLPATLLLLAPAFAGGPKSPISTSGDWEFSLSAGPAVRNVGQIKINSGYRSGGLTLPSFVGGSSLTVPPVGDAGAFADREYNDGYVRQDAGTPLDGSTWNWGYDDASQIQGGQLIYTATGFESTRTDTANLPSAGPASKDSLRGIAPHIQFDARSPHYMGSFRIGFSAGFDFTAVDQSLAFSNYSATQTREDYRLDYQDHYDLNGVIPPLAPYQGTFGGPGPLIDNLPTFRSITPVLVFTDRANFSNQVGSSINIDAFSFTFGPTLGIEYEKFNFTCSGGLIVNIYDWSASQTETLTASSGAGSSKIARWTESDSGTKIRPGVYAQADLSYAVHEEVMLGGFLRFDAAQEFRAQAGPTIYKIDPYGVTAGLQIRFALP